MADTADLDLLLAEMNGDNSVPAKEEAAPAEEKKVEAEASIEDLFGADDKPEEADKVTETPDTKDAEKKEEAPAPAKKPRGRPKGSTNKKTEAKKDTPEKADEAAGGKQGSQESEEAKQKFITDVSEKAVLDATAKTPEESKAEASNILVGLDSEDIQALAENVSTEISTEVGQVDETPTVTKVERTDAEGSTETLTGDSTTADGASKDIYVMSDAQIFNGHVYRRGQKITFTKGDKFYNSQTDRHGNNWLDFVDDLEAQVAHFGRVMVQPDQWTDIPIGSSAGITHPGVALAVAQIAQAELERNGRPYN